MAKTCYFCKQSTGMGGQFIKVKNPEQSAGKTAGKTLLRVATGYSRNWGFWVCKKCRKEKWNKGEPVRLRFSDGGQVYTFTK